MKAQSDSLVDITESYFILNTGVGYTSFPTGELSIGNISKFADNDTSDFNTQFMYLLGVEYWHKDKNPIFAPKLAFNVGLSNYLPFPVSTGFSFIYATDFSENTFLARLEWGILISNGRLFYGLALPLYNKTFSKDYRHQIGFSWPIRVSKKSKYKTFYNKETDTYTFEDYE
jgi:hypothetical protein